MLVFARKYRPKSLSEVIGQQSVVQTLSNSLTQDRLHHAYLFVGKFGSGKCVAPDTLVWTTQGLQRIGHLVPNKDGIHAIKCHVFDEQGIGVASSGYYESDTKTIQIKTQEGFKIEATPEHPIRVWTSQGLAWKEACKIKKGDWLPIIRRDMDLRDGAEKVKIDWKFNLKEYLSDRFGDSEYVTCQICGKQYGNLCTHLGTHGISSQDYKSTYRGCEIVSAASLKKNALKSFHDIALPDFVGERFARLCGYIVSEGGVSDGTLFVTNADPDILEDVTLAIQETFNIDPHIYLDKRTPDTYSVCVQFDKIAAIFDLLGFGQNSYNKRVPDVVLSWPPNMLREFLRAYFEGDGSAEKNVVSCCSRSEDLISDIQNILLYNGILSFVGVSKKGAVNGNNIKTSAYSLRIYGSEIRRFAEKVGFISRRKNNRLAKLLENDFYNPNKNVIPFIQDDLFKLKRKLPILNNGHFMVDGKTATRLRWPGNVSTNKPQHKNATYKNIEDCLVYFQKAILLCGHLRELSYEIEAMIDRLKVILCHNYFFSPVVSTDSKRNNVVDISKDGPDHSFFANGFVNHNTSTARILAASENCLTSPGVSPCGECDLCKAVFAGVHADISEIDAASSAGKVDQIRELKTAASYRPIDGAKTKYFIIDEAHRVSAAGSEALLKILEEPPSRVRFILCTTEMQQMRGTILSRCQVHEFKKIYWREMVLKLEHVVKIEKIDIEREALNVCARLADGSMRNALQNLEKLVDFAGVDAVTMEMAQKSFGTAPDRVFYDLVDEAIGSNASPDATTGYKIINDLLISGMGFDRICESISEKLRHILIACTAGGCMNLITIPKEYASRLSEQMKYCKPKTTAICHSLKSLVEAKTAVEYGMSSDVALQMWLLDTLLAFK